MESARIRSFTGPYFLAFGLNTPYLSVFSPNAYHKTPNVGTFHALPEFINNIVNSQEMLLASKSHCTEINTNVQKIGILRKEKKHK